MKRALYISLSSLVVFLVGTTLFFYRLKSADLVLPNTTFAGKKYGLIERKTALNAIEKRMRQFIDTPILIAVAGEVQQITPKDLGVAVDVSATQKKLKSAQKLSTTSIIASPFISNEIIPVMRNDPTAMKGTIDIKFSTIPRVKNARYLFQEGAVRIQDGSTGIKINYNSLLADMQSRQMVLSNEPIIAEVLEEAPNVTAQDLSSFQERIFATLPSEIAITYDAKVWKIPRDEYLGWIQFDRKNYPISMQDIPFRMSFADDSLNALLEKNIRSVVELEPENVKIWMKEKSEIENGRVHIQGKGSDGRNIDIRRLTHRMNDTIAGGEQTIDIPMITLAADIEISPELQAFGIKDRIAVGHSRFAGSPMNRQHNILTGISRYNGLVIKPGEVFSFNAHLGEVNESTGFKKELVIKPEGTIPEYGGGLCQVSTTLFRAAMDGGFPVVERAPHSYAVTYYSQVGGHGLDATIYPPYRDIKFKNDTSGHIVVQAYVDGVDAYYKFYGTSDGRRVTLDGPYISNRKSAPKEEVIFEDSELKPGQKEQVQKPLGGFDALWFRTIERTDGTAEKEKLFSRYQAVPAKFRVGREITPEAENQGLVPVFGESTP